MRTRQIGAKQGSAKNTKNSLPKANGLMPNTKALRREPRSLVQFFAQSPLGKVAINLDRELDYGRTVQL